MSQLQPQWPLKIDPYHGPYTAIEDVAKSIHQDFLQLLKTIPGEWPGRPDLGIGLVQHLFESTRSPEFTSLKSRIKSQVSKYLKAVEVTKIDIESPPEMIDSNQVKITLEYFIKTLGIKQTLGLATQDGNLKEVVDVSSGSSYERSPHRLPSAYGES